MAKPKAIRVQVSLDRDLVERVDRITSNRSAYIAHALRRALEAESA